jgi:hypothetical protein
VLAVQTSTGEAITVGVLAVFFALLALASARRGRRSVAVFYSVATLFAVALAAISAGGHVFHGL